MPKRFALVATAASTIFGATLLLSAQQPTAPTRTAAAQPAPLVTVTPAAVSQDMIDAGARLYSANQCADCHGPSGEGDQDFAPALKKTANWPPSGPSQKRSSPPYGLKCTSRVADDRRSRLIQP